MPVTTASAINVPLLAHYIWRSAPAAPYTHIKSRIAHIELIIKHLYRQGVTILLSIGIQNCPPALQTISRQSSRTKIQL